MRVTPLEYARSLRNSVARDTICDREKLFSPQFPVRIGRSRYRKKRRIEASEACESNQILRRRAAAHALQDQLDQICPD